MNNSLLFQKSGRVFLFVGYPDRFHIITVNNKLDNQAEQRVLSETCSNAVMDELGLARETIMKKDLRGVAIGGCCAGDTVILYTKNKKLKFTLSDDYDSNALNAIFDGIERFQSPKKSKARPQKVDWRTNMQTESMRKITRAIGLVLESCGFLCLIGGSWFGRLSTVWSIICLLITAFSFGLYLRYPQYYTIIDWRNCKRIGYTAKVSHLEIAVMGPALALTIRCMNDFCFPNWVPLSIASVVLGIAIFIIMNKFAREVKENTDLAIIVLLLSIIASLGMIGQLNHLLNFNDRVPQMSTVLNTEKDSNKGTDQHYCTVELDSGVEMEVPISNSEYDKLQPGDMVPIYIGQGAFGIEYAYLITPK